MVVHLGRTQQREAGPSAELGDTRQVAWCTDLPPEGEDRTTRLANLATCSECLAMWDDRLGEHERTIAEGPLISREALDEQMRGMGESSG